MRQNPHVRICGGPGSATTLVYPTPGRCPASRCACRTHVRSVSAVQPSFGATDCSTAHSEAWASRCSSTIRTARSRTSGENRLGRPIDRILPSNEVSEKPGTIQLVRKMAGRSSGRRHLTTDVTFQRPASGNWCLFALRRSSSAPGTPSSDSLESPRGSDTTRHSECECVLRCSCEPRRLLTRT